MNISVQFTMKVEFHFQEHGENRRRWFKVDDELCRRVPLEIEGIEGLHTVIMYFPQPYLFKPNDVVEVECAVINPEPFSGKLYQGIKGRLWDAGFFADVEITNVNEDNLKQAIYLQQKSQSNR